MSLIQIGTTCLEYVMQVIPTVEVLFLSMNVTYDDIYYINNLCTVYTCILADSHISEMNSTISNLYYFRYIILHAYMVMQNLVQYVFYNDYPIIHCEPRTNNVQVLKKTN